MFGDNKETTNRGGLCEYKALTKLPFNINPLLNPFFLHAFPPMGSFHLII